MAVEKSVNSCFSDLSDSLNSTESSVPFKKSSAHLSLLGVIEKIVIQLISIQQGGDMNHKFSAWQRLRKMEGALYPKDVKHVDD